MNFKSKRFIGLVITLLIWTFFYVLGLYTTSAEDKGFLIALGLPMYLGVLLCYVGVIAVFDMTKNISQQAKQPQEKISPKEFIKKHLLAIIFLAFLLYGFFFLSN